MKRISMSIARCFLPLCVPLCLLSCAFDRGGRIMTYDQYAQRHYYDPYLLQLHSGEGSLIYVGAAHSVDPAHPQVALIEKLWHDFKPTVAFTEGGVWSLGDSVEDAVIRFGEEGLVRFLAEGDSIPIHSLEPEIADEVKRACRQVSSDRLKVHYVLRQVAQFHRMNKADSLEAYTQKFLESLSSIPGLEGPPRNLLELENSVSALLPELNGWRNASSKWFSPVGSMAWTNDLAKVISRFRDEHMVEALAREVNNGQQVFAVVGFSHVVMQEPALRGKLR